MFEAKKTSLFEAKKSPKVDALRANANIFKQELYAQQHTTLSENGAIKLTTTGNPLVDDFGKLGQYKPNWNKQTKSAEYWNPNESFDRMELLYTYDPLMAVRELHYLRMITRDVKFNHETYKAQRGQGLKYEYICRMIWLGINHPNTFKKNLLISVSIGCWGDIFDMMELDLQYVHNGRNHALDWNWLIAFVANYLQDPDQCDLIKKYLPQIRSKNQCKTLHSQCTTVIAKNIAKYLFKNEDVTKSYTKYRKLKSSGTAHQWQQAISRQDYKNINFDAIAGRALNKLVNSKFIENHGLEKEYEEWMDKQPVAKFTGFPYELFKPLGDSYLYRYGYCNKLLKPFQIKTLNKQFAGLIETAKQNMNRESNFMVCVDTSGSMTGECNGTGLSAMTVARSMALYFAHLLEGRFANTFLEFESKVRIKTWQGETPYKQYTETLVSGYCGSTNFLGCADVFVELKRKGYPESEFPTGIICISDGEFNPASRWNSGVSSGGNFDNFLQKLRKGGFSEEFVSNFKMVLWDIPRGQSSKFEALANRENFFYMSGFDPAGIAFLTGKEVKDKPVATPKTAEELFYAAMDQEILNKIEL